MWLMTIGKLIKKVPWQVYAVLLLAASFLLYGHMRFNAGQADVQAQWDASVERGREEIARLKAEAGKVTVKVETRTVEKIKYVEVQGKEREKIVYKFIPADTPDLPAGFRVFHDAAVEGTIPDSAAIADAAPVPVKDVASTINYNYAQCQKAYILVWEWQQWYKEQEALNKNR